MSRSNKVPVPHLREKLELVPHRASKAAVLAESIEHDAEVGKSIDPGHFSVAKRDSELPRHFVAGVLKLFELDVPTPLDWSEGHPDSAYYRLLAEPDLAVFVAKVRLAGGRVLGEPSGALWDRFCESAWADEVRSSCVQIHRLGEQMQPGGPGPTRALQGNEVPPAELAQSVGEPTYQPGEPFYLQLSLANVIPSRERYRHVFCFYDVFTQGRRVIWPLLPGPTVQGVDMPSTVTDESLMEVPHEPALETNNFLRMDPGWDARTLVVLVTDHPLGEDILADTRIKDRLMPLERLDILAAHLGRKRKEAWALMRRRYRVAAPSSPVVQTAPVI